MHLETLAPVRARAASRLLEQYLISCPGCGKPAAVHVDRHDELAGDVEAEDDGPVRPTVVRIVCPDGCAVADADVLASLPVQAAAPLSA